MLYFHHQICQILTVFLIVGCTTLLGCTVSKIEKTSESKSVSKEAIKKAEINQLIFSPDPYVGNTVEVSGEVYAIKAFRRSIVVSLTDNKIIELLDCEFPKAEPPHDNLEKGQQITVIGKVDVIKNVIFLRNCRVKNSE